MNNIESYEVEEFIINRLRSNQTKIRFCGHMGVSEEELDFCDTIFAIPEAKHPEANYWMKPRTNKYFVDDLELRLLIAGNVLNESIFEEWKKGNKTKPLPIASNDCWECGERTNTYFDGVTFMFAEAKSMAKAVDDHDTCLKCRFPGGIGEYTVEVDVPSGRLVFANDLRPMMPEEIPDYYVNYAVGIYDTVIDTAKQNFLTAFVGNTCPNIFQSGNMIVVGNEGFDDDDNVTGAIDGTRTGSICTDLWWFYAVDGDCYDSSDAEYKPEIEVSVNLQPGRYRMTVHKKASGSYDYTKAEKFATIERV